MRMMMRRLTRLARPDLFAYGLRIGFDHGKKISDFLHETRQLRAQRSVVPVRLEHTREALYRRSECVAHAYVLEHHGVYFQSHTIHDIRGG